MADKRFLLITTVPKSILKEDDFDFYEYTYNDYSQMILYDIDAGGIIFDEDTGLTSPWAHYEHFIDALHYVDITVEIDFAYIELPDDVNYLGAAAIHEAVANENYVVVEK